MRQARRVKWAKEMAKNPSRPQKAKRSGQQERKGGPGPDYEQTVTRQAAGWRYGQKRKVTPP